MMLMTTRQIPHTRALATVRDAPLDKNVEMTNWEKVRNFRWHHAILPFHPLVDACFVS